MKILKSGKSTGTFIVRLALYISNRRKYRIAKPREVIIVEIGGFYKEACRGSTQLMLLEKGWRAFDGA